VTLPEIFGDAGDESLPEAVAAIAFVDGEEEHVAVGADRGESDERVGRAVDVDVDPRAAVGVAEEAAALAKDAVFLADPFLELPGRVHEPVVAAVDDP